MSGGVGGGTWFVTPGLNEPVSGGSDDGRKRKRASIGHPIVASPAGTLPTALTRTSSLEENWDLDQTKANLRRHREGREQRYAQRRGAIADARRKQGDTHGVSSAAALGPGQAGRRSKRSRSKGAGASSPEDSGTPPASITALSSSTVGSISSSGPVSSTGVTSQAVQVADEEIKRADSVIPVSG